jgi:hypothetical protein
VELEEDSGDNYVNPEDGEGGILLNGTLPIENDQGVHSLTDVVSIPVPTARETYTDFIYPYLACICHGPLQGVVPRDVQQH